MAVDAGQYPVSARTVGEFLDALGSRSPTPGGGAVAAITVATAAGLVAMAARFASGDLTGLAAPADELRERACDLADADVTAYRRVAAAFRLPAGQADRAQRITEALHAATTVPLRIANAGCTVADLAARLAAEGNPKLSTDVRAAATLAEAAVRIAADVVRTNTELGLLDTQLALSAETFLWSAANALRASTRGSQCPPA